MTNDNNVPKNRILVRLEDEVFHTLRVARLFRGNTNRINSIDFSLTGERLISSSDDDQIILYDCESGSSVSTVFSSKYGVDLVSFTRNASSVIHASRKVDDNIRYLSLHDKKYIRYFQGHKKKVVTLSMSPVQDSFLSASLDGFIRLWDLRAVNPQLVRETKGRPIGTFDPEGLIFAVGIDSHKIEMFDNRSVEKGPFAKFMFPRERDCEWTGIKFSPDGKTIAVSTNGHVIRLIDAFEGGLLQTFSGFTNGTGVPIEASFSPDSRFLFTGSTDGRIHVWNQHTGKKLTLCDPEHSGSIQCVQFNPKYMLLASASHNLAFWVPKLTPEEMNITS